MIVSPLFRGLFRVSLTAAIAVVGVLKAHGHGTFHERVEALTAALRAKPDDPQILFQLAAANLEHGDWEVALLHLSHIDKIAPGKLATDLLRGQALAAGGKFEAARARLDAFLAAHPAHPVALAARARVVSELGDPAQAAADSAAAVAATPHPEPDAYFELAAFLVAAGRGADAVRALDDGLAKLGAVVSLLERAIELELALGRSDAAIARSAAQATTPATRAAHATVLARAGRAAEARAAWQALRGELAALPPLERASHSMLRLAEQANTALAGSPP